MHLSSLFAKMTDGRAVRPTCALVLVNKAVLQVIVSQQLMDLL